MLKILIFGIPLIVTIEFLLIQMVFWLLSEPDDIAVLFGVVSLCFFLFLNYSLIKYIKTKLTK